MGKDYKSLGVNKAATTGGGNGKRPAGAYYKSLGVNRSPSPTAGGGNGKRSGGGAGRAGAVGAKGAGGAGALTFSPSYQSTFRTAEMVTKTTMARRTEVRLSFSPDHTTSVKVMDEYYHEEENRCSIEDAKFSPADHGTVGTDMGVMNEYYDEEENHCLYANDDAELLPYEEKNVAKIGGDGGYYKDVWVGDDEGAEAGFGDDILNGDYYNYDVVGAFDNGYEDDGGDGADDWW